MVGLGWKSVGVLELTALPSVGEERWVPLVREADVLLVAGGDVLYLCHWMRESGLADLLPVAERDGVGGAERGEHGDDPRGRGRTSSSGGRRPATTRTLGLVDFSICPHLAADGMPGNSMAEAEQWAAGIPARRTRSTTRRPSRWSMAR